MDHGAFESKTRMGVPFIKKLHSILGVLLFLATFLL
jgi:hypothetical protein